MLLTGVRELLGSMSGSLMVRGSPLCRCVDASLVGCTRVPLVLVSMLLCFQGFKAFTEVGVSMVRYSWFYAFCFSFFGLLSAVRFRCWGESEGLQRSLVLLGV